MRATSGRTGFSLLEMLLALAILGGSLGILSTIAMQGADAAREAECLGQARLIAQSRLAVILAAGLHPASVPPTPTPAADAESLMSFEYQVDVAMTPMQGMLAIRVVVRALDANGGPPIATYAITRWMIDPLLGLADEATGV